MVRDHGHGHGDGGPRSSPGPEEGVYILLTILGGRRWLPPISRDAQGERFRHDTARGGTRRRRVRRRRRRGWRRGGRGGGGEEEEEREDEGGRGKEEGGGRGLVQVVSARGVGVGVGTVAGSSSSAAAGAGPRVATSGKHSLPTLQWSSPKPRWAGSAWPCAHMADLSTRAPPFFAPPPPRKAICAVRRLARRRRRKNAASRQPADFQ